MPTIYDPQIATMRSVVCAWLLATLCWVEYFAAGTRIAHENVAAAEEFRGLQPRRHRADLRVAGNAEGVILCT